MSMRNLTIATGILALAIGAGAAVAEGPRLGKPITQSDLAEWDINILPDGTNLPPGSGKAADGAKIFAEKCVACHGEGGKGGIAARVIGGPPKATLDGGKTIPNYWPYATTVFDYIRRAMPYDQPGTLQADEIYSLVGFLLNANGIVGENDEMNATTLPKVKMPNRDGFVPDARPDVKAKR